MAYTRLNKARTKQTTRTKDGGQVSRYERYETGLITGNHRSMIAVIADEAGYDGLGFQPDAGTPDDSYHVLNVFNEKGGYIDTMAVGGAMDDEHAVTVASTQLHRFGGDKLKVVSGQAAQYDSLSLGHSESLSVVPATTWSIDAISKLMDNPSQDRGFTPLITGSELDREAVRVTYDDVEWSEPQWDGSEIIGGNQLLSHGGRDSNLYLDMTRADTLNQLVAPFDLRDELAAIGATDEPSYDALIENKGRLHILCDRLFSAMARSAVGDVKVISRTQTKEFKRGGVMNIAFVFELSDGQAISIWFHSPDNTPAKLLPQDVMISWKWMLNKRDVTAILSPKSGDNVALPALASRMLRLAAKNSKRFASTQARAIKAAEELEQAQADYDAKQATIVQLDADIADLTAKIDVAMTAPKLTTPVSDASDADIATVNDGSVSADAGYTDEPNKYSLSPKDLKEFQKGLDHAPQDVKSDILAEIDKLKQSLDAKGVSYLGEHKYQDAINSGEQVGMSLSGQIKRLKEHEQQVVALRDKKIRPSEIVGSGYSNPRIAAFQSLGMSITRVRLSINGNPSGFNETVNLSNYRGYLQSALKNADKTMAQNSGDASQPENFLPFSYDEDFGDYTSYYDGTKKDSVSVRYNENKDGWDLYTDDELSRGFNTQDDPKFIKTTADLVARYPSFTGIDAAHELNKSRKNTKENTMRAISAFSKTHANFEGFIASNNDAEKALYGKKKGSWVAHITSDNNVTVFMALDDASAYTGATNSDVESAYNDIFSNSKAAAARLGTDYDLADIENKETPVVTGLGGQDTPTPTPITPENVAVGDRVVWRGVADLHGIFRGFTNDGAQAVIVINGSQMTAPTSEVYLDNTPLDNNPNEPKNANEKTTSKRVIEGKSNNAKTPKGTKITSNFALVDAKFLIASHTASGSKNPKYPQDLQPRDRARESSIAWVQKTSKSLDPESLGRTSRVDTGAPIAGDDLIVESGNGRTIAIKMAYRDGNAGEYREWLIENADMFGFTPNQVESFKQPILVRIRKTEVNRAEFAVEANQDDKLSFTASERAKSDAKRITNGMLDLFNPSESGDLLSASNYDFVKTFLGSLGDTEAAQYTDSNGQPTQALAARMKAAVFSKAYNDDRLLEMMADQTNPDLQNMINALSLAAGKFVEAQASNRSQAIDITDGLVNAVEQSLNDKVKSAIIEASNILSNAKRNNQGVAEYVTQLGLFEEISPATAELAVFLANNSRSAKKMAEYFKAMAGFVDNNAKQNQTLDIFGDPEPVSLSDVINHANKVTGTNDLFSEENMPAPAGTTEPNTQNDAIAQRVNDLETAVGAADFDPSSLNADDLTSLVDDVQAYPELAARVSGIIKTYQEKAVAVAMSVLSSLNGGA